MNYIVLVWTTRIRPSAEGTAFLIFIGFLVSWFLYFFVSAFQPPQIQHRMPWVLNAFKYWFFLLPCLNQCEPVWTAASCTFSIDFWPIRFSPHLHFSVWLIHVANKLNRNEVSLDSCQLHIKYWFLTNQIFSSSSLRCMTQDLLTISYFLCLCIYNRKCYM